MEKQIICELDEFAERLQNIRLLALDLDGTLLNNKRVITPYTKEKLISLQKKGVWVTYVTGRLYYSSRYHARIVGFRTPLGCLNGSLVGDTEGGILYNKPIPSDIIYSAIKKSREYKYPVYFFLFSAEDIICESCMPNIPHDVVVWNLPKDLKYISNLDNLEEEAIYQILIIGEQKSVEGFQAFLTEEKVFQSLKFTGYLSERYSTFYLEIKMPGDNKGEALKKISSYLGVYREETLAVGDWLNDIDLLKEAGISVAVGNAVPEVKEQADIVLPWSNDEEGIARLIERML